MPRHTATYKTPWVVVAGGVNRLGGTDKANFAFVEYLLKREVPVHVVTHRIDQSLLSYPTIRAELVPVPGGSWFLGEKLLSFRGCRVAQRILARHPSARVVTNGGNCPWSDINWVHRVHHAWVPEKVQAPWIHRVKHRMATAAAQRREVQSLRSARLIIANSELTRRQLIEILGLDPNIIRTVYLGSESTWAPAPSAERAMAREFFRQQDHRPLVTFIGAIGYDNNKGLDILLRVWRDLCREPQWDADLIIAGDGRALPKWRRLVEESDFQNRVRFLGFTDRISDLLAASDLLVSPVRYESYGLNVQEALCRGVPAIVSANAGIAERYPLQLRDLLLPDPEDVDDLVRRILRWRSNSAYWRQQVVRFSKELRTYSWRDMAEQFYVVATNAETAMTERPLLPTLSGTRY